MFCPVCSTEYRPGFTQCSDCQVALVEELPAEGTPSAYRILWKGENGDFASELSDELRAAGLRNAVVPLDLLSRNSRDYFDLIPKPLFGLAVCVTQRDYSAAKDALEKMLIRRREKSERARIGSVLGDLITVEPPELPLGWDERTATVEVLRHHDTRAVSFRADSLRGVGIPSTQVPQDDKEVMLRVRPEDAERAREIIRQIDGSSASVDPPPDQLGTLWGDEPIRSYLLLWAVPLIFLLLAFICVQLQRIFPSLTDLVTLLIGLGAAVANIGALWMLYQAIRYELYPLRFIVCSFVPLSYIWYYFERYLPRRGIRRLPIAERMRMLPKA